MGFKDVGVWNEGDWITAIAVAVLLGFLAIGGVVAGRKTPEFAGHPKGLYMLFFAEMWERFSFYGMRALLVFYLTKHWLFDDGKAQLIYGSYLSLVYITPVLGGYLADRYLGQRKAVLFGGVLLALGHLFMAVEGPAAAGHTDNSAIYVFWLALALIIVGSGFLKANISVMVGQLYPLTDVRRDPAYTIFYMGINVGAALGTILVGYLGETLGWGWGFGLAGIGMVAGLVVFVLGKGALNGAGEPPRPIAKGTEWGLYAAGAAAVAVMWGLIQYQDVIQTLLVVSGIALLGYVAVAATFQMPYGSIAAAPQRSVWLMFAGVALLFFLPISNTLELPTSNPSAALSFLGIGAVSLATLFAVVGALLVLSSMVLEKQALEHHPRDRMFAILFLIALNPLFWGLFEQAGGSLNLYTDRFVDGVGEGGVPASLFQSINPIFIILLAPVFAALWQMLGKRRLEPSAPAKFAFALMLVGLGFLVFVLGANSVGAAATPVLFVFLIYFLHTAGELCLSPVGLSAMNRLAPAYLASLIMGAWFYMTAVGNFVAAKIGEATGGEDGEMTKEATLAIYNQIGWVAIAVGVVVLLISPIVKRWMHLDSLGDRNVTDDMLGRDQLAEPAAAGLDTRGETERA